MELYEFCYSEIRLSFSFLLTFPYHSVPLNDVIGTFINEISSTWEMRIKKNSGKSLYFSGS